LCCRIGHPNSALSPTDLQQQLDALTEELKAKDAANEWLSAERQQYQTAWQQAHTAFLAASQQAA
jgi:hypothetical protein